MAIPRKVSDGVYYCGKDGERRIGESVYFFTKSTMGTYGERKGHVNFLGEIRIGSVTNPTGIIAVDYALSKDSYLPTSVKATIREVIKRLMK